jgi:hypothetical protein
MREKELDREEATGEGEGERMDRALSRPVNIMLVSVQEDKIT